MQDLMFRRIGRSGFLGGSSALGNGPGVEGRAEVNGLGGTGR
jgi:hypothetical protein